MYEPQLYSKANEVQREVCKKIVEEFFDYIKIRPDGNDSLVDIGCGTGDVLMEFVYPKLPKTSSKIVGIDLSEPMVQYSRKNYCLQYDNVQFDILDIRTESLPMEFREQFHHVTSFCCLNWVNDHEKAFSNIFNMMADNGDFLIAFPIYCAVFDCFETLAMNPKWTEYMKDIKEFIPNTQNNPNAQVEYKKLLEELRFRDIKVEIKSFDYLLKGKNNFEDSVVSVNPMIGRIPPSKREEYIKDLMSCCDLLKISDESTDANDQHFKIKLEMLVACGRKQCDP